MFCKLGKYDFKDMYSFEELPKGDMFTLSMNPYTGQVFCKFEKHQASSHIALEIMKQIVKESGELFLGSKDPLRDYAQFTDRRSGLERLQLLEGLERLRVGREKGREEEAPARTL